MPINKIISRKDFRICFDFFFESYRKNDQPGYLKIQMLSNTLGAPPEVQWLPLKEDTFDFQKESLSRKLKDLNHRIAHPTEIHVGEKATDRITGMEIIAQDESREIIGLR